MNKQEIKEQLADGLDKVLLDVLHNGQTVLDANGTPTVITPTAAMLNVIRGRLKDIASSSVISPGTPQSDLLKEAHQKFASLRIADVDDAPDAATGT